MGSLIDAPPDSLQLMQSEGGHIHDLRPHPKGQEGHPEPQRRPGVSKSILVLESPGPTCSALFARTIPPKGKPIHPSTTKAVAHDHEPMVKSWFSRLLFSRQRLQIPPAVAAGANPPETSPKSKVMVLGYLRWMAILQRRRA